MKRIATLVILFFCFAISARSQQQPWQRFGDTIYGLNPEYYYDFNPVTWLNSDDTMITHVIWDCIGSYYDSVLGQTVYRYGYRSVTEKTIHELRFDDRDYGVGEYDHAAIRQYTERPIIVKGLAGAIWSAKYLGFDASEDPFYYASSIPFDTVEFLSLYEIYGDSITSLRRVDWRADDSNRYQVLPFRHNRYTSRWCCCYQVVDTTWTLPIKEYYFDEPALVKDSFYVGWSKFTSTHDFPQIRVWEYGDTNTMVGKYGFFHFGNGLIDTLCLFVPPHRAYLNSWESCTGNPFPPGVWAHYDHDPTEAKYPMIWAIYEDACPGVSGARDSLLADGSILLMWDSSQYSTRWELMYGIEGTPDSTWTWTSCNTPRYFIPLVDTSVAYIVKVRAECFIDSLYYGEWDSIRLEGGRLVEIPIVEPEPLEVHVHPNPAHGRVQVLSSAPMKQIEIYDLLGHRLGSAAISGTQMVMDVQNLKPATYLLRIQTDEGLVTKKLVVN